MLLWSYYATALIWILHVQTGICGEVVSVMVGETAHLPCVIVHHDSVAPPHVIEWSRSGNSVPVFIKIGKYPAHVNPEFKGRMSIRPNSAALRIQKVKIPDEGWYECRVIYFHDSATENTNQEMVNGTWIKLVVKASPTMNPAPPPSMTARVGERLFIRCRIVGKPEPEITWRKDGWLIRNGENGISVNGGELAVTSLRKSHRGDYECQGRNSEGQIEHTTTVYIQAPPEMTVAPKNVTVKEGQDAFFSCKGTGFPSYITYSWSYNDIPISEVPSLIGRHNTQSDGTFVIYNVIKTDTGHVTCQARNDFGKSPAASASLVVQYPARVTQMTRVVYGGLSLKLTLYCHTEAEPPVSAVTWRKDGDVLMTQKSARVHVTNDGSLQINHVQYVDEGSYACTPYNILGTKGESPHVRLVVKVPPRFTLRPQPKFEVEIGRPLKAFCKGEGDPTPAISWRKVGATDTTLPDERVSWNGGNVTFTSITKDDHGLWQCVVSNAVAEITSDVKIFVKYTTPHLVTNITVVTSFNSARLSWLAGYDGGYPQYFMIWYKRADKGDHAWSTSSVDGSHTEATVSRLRPEVVYQFAVLPENVLGSGPFSKTVTKMTEALPTTSPPPRRDYVPPPRGLRYDIDENGMIVLSWQPPASVDQDNLQGYLVEYRMNSQGGDKNDTISSSKSDSNSRQKRRSLSEAERIIGRRSSFDNPAELLESAEERWRKLAAFPANTTSAIVPTERLHRGVRYEFRVLAVSRTAYSPPSTAITITTTGLQGYPAAVENVNAGLVSGIVAGVVFIIVAIGTAVGCYCHQRKSDSAQRQRNGSKGEVSESFLANQKKDDTFKPRRTSDVTPLKVSFVKREPEVEGAVTSKSGVLQKIKFKLEKGKTKNDSTKEILVRAANNNNVKRSKSVSHGHSSKHISPIYRASDGKFHVTDRSDQSSSSVDRRTRRHKGLKYYAESDSEEVMRGMRRKEHDRKSRPVSDSYIHRDVDFLNDQQRYWTPHPASESILENEEDDGPTLEIDCSSSNIEVRYVPNEVDRPGPNRSTRPLHRNHSLQNQRAAANRSNPGRKSSFDRPMTSYTSEPTLPPSRIPCDASDYPGGSSRYCAAAEYVYLRDLGLPCPDTPVSEVSDPGCFSPAPELLSSHNPTPAGPPKNKYHIHSSLPGGHYHLTPRGSFADQPPRTSPDTLIHGFPPSHWKRRASSPEAAIKPIIPNMKLHSRSQFGNQNLNSVRNRSDVSRVSSLDRHRKYSITLPVLQERPGSRIVEEQHALTDCESSPPMRTVEQRNNNNSSLDFPSQQRQPKGFKSHSCSLPSLSLSKSYPKLKDSRKTIARRSASEEILGLSDTDSERRCSFTSGSTSTVRHLPSRESNLSLAGSSRTMRDPAPPTSSHGGSNLRHEEQQHSPRSENSGSSLSPQLPSSETGAGSTSGYDSQNTSSDTSSHGSRGFGGASHRFNSSEETTSCYHDHNASRSEFRDHDHRITNLNVALNIPNYSGIRASNASSGESRSRKDNSSVDEKYEWDSEFAMESEILEALKNFETHKREGPVSKDLLQELRKLDRDALSPEVDGPRPEVNTANKLSSNPDLDSRDEDSLLSPTHDDTNYTKEKMEKRCAALKEEYLEYQRRHNPCSDESLSFESSC